MSIRAYKIIEIKHEKTPTFNFNEDGIGKVLNYATYQMTNTDGEIGEIEFDVKYLKEKLKDKKSWLKKEAKDLVKKIIKEAGENEYVSYYCF